MKRKLPADLAQASRDFEAFTREIEAFTREASKLARVANESTALTSVAQAMAAGPRVFHDPIMAVRDVAERWRPPVVTPVAEVIERKLIKVLERAGRKPPIQASSPARKFKERDVTRWFRDTYLPSHNGKRPGRETMIRDVKARFGEQVPGTFVRELIRQFAPGKPGRPKSVINKSGRN